MIVLLLDIHLIRSLQRTISLLLLRLGLVLANNLRNNHENKTILP